METYVGPHVGFQVARVPEFLLALEERAEHGHAEHLLLAGNHVASGERLFSVPQACWMALVLCR